MERQKAMNHKLGNLLRCLVGDKPKGWDMILLRWNFHIIILSTRLLVNHHSILYMGSPKNASELWHLDKGETSSVEAEEFVEHLKHL